MLKAAKRIEELRVAWERDIEQGFAAQASGERPLQVDPGEKEPRVRLERTMAERVHRVAEKAAERLGCTDRFVLYQTPKERRHLTAQALLSERPFAIRLVGPVARSLDDGALAALIGHELGHWLALGPRAAPPSVLLGGWERGAPLELCELAHVAAEITADLFSLIAADGEVEAAVRLDVAIATFDSPEALGVRELAHLEVLRGRVERREAPLFERGSTLTSAFRLYATWLFWRSDVHRALTGAGPGDLALRDVDAMLRRMCDEQQASRPRLEEPPAAPDPAAPSPPVPVRPGVMLEDRAHAAVASIAAILGRIVDVAGGSPGGAAPATDDDDGAATALDDLDDLEQRFRALEREAGPGASSVPAPEPASLDDLEARFRALEERERLRGAEGGGTPGPDG